MLVCCSCAGLNVSDNFFGKVFENGNVACILVSPVRVFCQGMC